MTAEGVMPITKSRRATAYREAGHAVAMLHYGLKFKFAVAYRGEDPQASGRVYAPLSECFMRVRPWEFGVICLAGIATEQRVTGVDAAALVYHGGRYDVAQAHRAVQRIGCRVEDLVADTVALIRTEWPRIEALAEALLDAPSPEGIAFDAVLALYQRPRWRSPRWDGMARAA